MNLVNPAVDVANVSDAAPKYVLGIYDAYEMIILDCSPSSQLSVSMYHCRNAMMIVQIRCICSLADMRAVEFANAERKRSMLVFLSEYNCCSNVYQKYLL